MGRLGNFIRDWMLVIAIAGGALLYLAYHFATPLHVAGPVLSRIVAVVQPLLLFLMLFLTFCKIEPRELRPHRWQAWLLLFQGGAFVLLAMVIHIFPQMQARIPLEAAMLCLICPTATACAVVTGKLGGDIAGVITYTIAINLLTAVLVPLFIPLIYPVEGMTFIYAFSRILAKVFPLLIMPCLLAWFIRYFIPRLHKAILRYPDLAFHVWAVSLALAIATSTRAILLNEDSATLLLWIALASALSCVLQFHAGKMIGAAYGQRITAGQALGQKNTVFAIWMGYTFMDPIVSIAGGFYSIWHNIFNSRQLYRARKGTLKE